MVQNMRMGKFFLYVALICLGISGCASFKEYRNEAPKNFQVSAEIEPSTFFTKTTLELHLYRMNGSCPQEYLGAIRLSDKPVEVSIEPGQKTYLKFLFTKVRSNSVSELEYGTIVTPKHGAHYQAEAKYAGRRYEVRVREVGPQGGTIQDFERQYLNCKDS